MALKRGERKRGLPPVSAPAVVEEREMGEGDRRVREKERESWFEEKKWRKKRRRRRKEKGGLLCFNQNDVVLLVQNDVVLC